jgi:hypothetical protein
MIQILPAPENVVAVRVAGKLTSEDYQRLFTELNSRLEQHEHIGVYTDATEIAGVGADAVIKDLRYAFGRLGELHRISREAIVTEKRWLRMLSRVADAVLPQSEIRAFGASEREAALSWAAGVPSQAHQPALRNIPTNRSDTFAFAWNGKISVEDMTAFVRELTPALASPGQIRLLGRIEHLGGLVPGAITESGLLPLKQSLFRRLERYAIVGGPRWLKRYVRIAQSVSKIDVRHFDESREQEAWQWLDAQPAATSGLGDQRGYSVS